LCESIAVFPFYIDFRYKSESFRKRNTIFAVV